MGSACKGSPLRYCTLSLKFGFELYACLATRRTNGVTKAAWRSALFRDGERGRDDTPRERSHRCWRPLRANDDRSSASGGNLRAAPLQKNRAPSARATGWNFNHLDGVMNHDDFEQKISRSTKASRGRGIFLAGARRDSASRKIAGATRRRRWPRSGLARFERSRANYGFWPPGADSGGRPRWIRVSLLDRRRHPIPLHVQSCRHRARSLFHADAGPPLRALDIRN